MAGYRKLGRTSSQRKAMIRSQVTALLYHGKIRTTETRAKEIRKVAEGLIAMAVREKDNFETVTVTAKVPRKDANGKRVKEVVNGKKVTVYDEVQKEIKKDQPSRLHARRQMLRVLYDVTEVPTTPDGSIITRSGRYFVSTSSRDFPKSPTSEQQIQPEFISRISIPESFRKPPSIPISPNSFSIRTTCSPAIASLRSFLIKVVLPAPKNPEIISIFVIISILFSVHPFINH